LRVERRVGQQFALRVEVVNTLKTTTDEAFLITVGNLVRKLSEVTERRRAEGTRAAIEHDPDGEVSPPVDPWYNPDDPGLEWEEVEDDE
jgi:hypothetical protein